MNTEMVDKYLETASDQAKFDHITANELSESYPITLNRDYIVKVLDTPKVKVQVERPVDSGKKDPNTGANIYEGTEIVEEERDNPIGEAIIISCPTHPMAETVTDYVPGEHVLFLAQTARDFFWIPKTHMVNPFNIIGRIKPEAVKAIESDNKHTNDGTVVTEVPTIEG